MTQSAPTRHAAAEPAISLQIWASWIIDAHFPEATIEERCSGLLLSTPDGMGLHLETEKAGALQISASSTLPSASDGCHQLQTFRKIDEALWQPWRARELRLPQRLRPEVAMERIAEFVHGYEREFRAATAVNQKARQVYADRLAGFRAACALFGGGRALPETLEAQQISKLVTLEPHGETYRVTLEGLEIATLGQLAELLDFERQAAQLGQRT